MKILRKEVRISIEPVEPPKSPLDRMGEYLEAAERAEAKGNKMLAQRQAEIALATIGEAVKGKHVNRLDLETLHRLIGEALDIDARNRAA